jgi:hypothetical protein
MAPSYFDAEIAVTVSNVERLSADVRARARAGATRIALTIAKDSEWSDEAIAVFTRECQRICTWLVGLLGAGKPAPRIAVDLPDGSRLSACYAAAMQPYAALLRRQVRATRLTTALVAATVAGVAVTACGGTTQASASDAGVSDAASGQGGYAGGVCAVATGGYGGGVCPVAVGVDSGVVGTGGYNGGGICAVAVDSGLVGTGGYGAGVCAYYPDTGIGGGVCPVMVDIDAGEAVGPEAGLGGICR